MDKKQTVLRLAGTAVIACLMAGAVASAVIATLGIGAHAQGAYFGAAIGALIAGLCALSTLSAILTVAGATVGAGVWFAAGLSEGGAVRVALDAIQAVGAGEGIELLAGSAGLIAGAFAAVLAVIFYVLLSERGAFSTLFAAGFCLAATVVCAAVSEHVRLWQLAPAIVGCAAAIAHSAEQRRTGGHLKALIPALAAVGLAFALVPASGVTFAPLEDAATRVKQIYEDYFNYTQERVAFSISEHGYNYYGMRDNAPTHMLGGPRTPATSP